MKTVMKNGSATSRDLDGVVYCSDAPSRTLLNLVDVWMAGLPVPVKRLSFDFNSWSRMPQQGKYLYICESSSSTLLERAEWEQFPNAEGGMVWIFRSAEAVPPAFLSLENFDLLREEDADALLLPRLDRMRDVVREHSQRNLLHQVFESSPSSLVVFDGHSGEQNQVYANPAFENLATPLQPLRKATDFLASIKDLDSRRQVEQKLLKGDAFEAHAHVELASGSKTFHLSGMPGQENGGHLCLAFDITGAGANNRNISERNRILAAQLLIQNKMLRGDPIEGVCGEMMELLENLTGGSPFLELPSFPQCRTGFSEPSAATLLGLLENVGTQDSEKSALFYSGDPADPCGFGSLQEWFNGDAFCLYTWETSRGKRAVAGIKREKSLGNWSQAVLEMIRAFGQLLSVGKEQSVEIELPLSEAEEALRRLPFAMLIISGDGQTVFENGALKQFKKIHGPGLIQRLTDLVTEQIGNSGKTNTHARSLLKQIDDQYWLRLTWAPVEQGGKHLLVIQDVSGQMELENKVRHYKHYENLGRMRLEVQHEWSNTIGVFKLALNCLRQQLPGASSNKFFRALENSGASIEGLAKQIQVYTGEGRLNLERQDLNAWATSKRDFLAQIWGPKIHFDYIFKHVDFPVAVDDPCLIQAVQSILVHLFPKTASEGQVFTIQTSLSENGKYAELTLSAGKASRTMPVVFDRFVPDSLPMEIAAKILEEHGGSLKCLKAEGESFAFRCYLPIDDTKQDKAEIKGQLPARLNHSTSVLVVEDNPHLLLLIRSCLENVDCRVETASHAGEAFALWKKYQSVIELCIVDVNLPGDENGVELVTKLRKKKPNLPVIFMSGYDRHELKQRFKLGKDDLLLNKPFSGSSLMSKIKELTGRS